MHGTARRGIGTPQRHLARGRRIRPLVSRRGISLVETLVAFAILAVAMTVLGQLLFWAMHDSAFSRRRAQATLLAQERMEDLLAHRADLAAWEAATKTRFVYDLKTEWYCFDEREPGPQHPELSAFRWKWLIEDMKDHPGLKKISVQLRWLRSGVEGAGGERDLWTALAAPGRLQTSVAAEPNRLEGATQ
jgi:type II secretory pathway pseudopilin PulG